MFYGQTPTYETTYEYDDDGRLTRSVTRQVESEWDDDWRDLALELDEYDSDSCRGCRTHESVIDAKTPLTFDERHCPVCAGQQQYGRYLSERDKQAQQGGAGIDKRALDKALAARPEDGRSIYIRPMSAAEVEARAASPGSATANEPRPHQK